MPDSKTTGPKGVASEPAQLLLTKRSPSEINEMRSDLTSRVIKVEDLEDDGKDMRRKFNTKLRKAQRERNSLTRVLAEHEAAYPGG